MMLISLKEDLESLH